MATPRVRRLVKQADAAKVLSKSLNERLKLQEEAILLNRQKKAIEKRLQEIDDQETVLTTAIESASTALNDAHTGKPSKKPVQEP